MAIDSGTWKKQDKKLPGVFINVLASQNNIFPTFSSRGYVAMPLLLDWGYDGGFIEITSEEFKKNSTEIFGYHYTHEKMKNLRELFRNALVLYGYRCATESVKAECNYATAKYKGVRGNDIRINITAVEAESEIWYKVDTLVGTNIVDTQLIKFEQTTPTTSDLRNNNWVDWKTNVELVEGTVPLTGGVSQATIKDTEINNFTDALLRKSFNILAIPYTLTLEQTQALVDWTKMLRDTLGHHFQLVIPYNEDLTLDHEGIISTANTTKETGGSVIYWMAGACANCGNLNEANSRKSLTNAIYDGEYTINCDYSQEQLIEQLDKGLFVFHEVGDTIRVLKDINTLKTIHEGKSDEFKNNQIIRTIDQISVDTTSLFVNKYLGSIENDEIGRAMLKVDITDYLTQLNTNRIIQEFDPSTVKVSPGETKTSVLAELTVNPTGAMTQLYMTITII